MSFQLPAPTTTAASTGFSFGLTSTPAATGAKPAFTFGSSGSGDAGKPLSLGTTPAVSASSTLFGEQKIPTFGGFGVTAAAPTGTGTGVPATNTTAPPLLSFGLTPSISTATAATGAAPTLSTTFALPKPAGDVSSGLAAPTSSAPSVSLPTTTATGFASLTTATKTTDSANVAPAQVSYNQLEEHINKWTLALEEQEKVFTEQATQINAWDKILISNNQKILELNDAVLKVKTDQHTLEQELEFLATQHHELEESIVPLQKEFMKIPQVDLERSQTYLMVENLDTQLKQMSEDLKEIIDNLNEANKGQDNTDPIIQIGKILNAHMSSLQWIESSTSNINNKLDDITKMHETFKRDSERSFRSAYYN